MGRANKTAAKKASVTEVDVAALRREIVFVNRRLAHAEARLQDLAKLAGAQNRRQDTIVRALALGERSKKGDRGVIQDLQESIVRLEDYLLKTAERIENILSALKQHREFLVSVNKRVLDLGTKDRIRLELDVMKNTLSILSLNGMEFDGSVVKEIDRLRASVREAEDLEVLEQSKTELDKKFDLDAIWARKKEIPGYR